MIGVGRSRSLLTSTLTPNLWTTDPNHTGGSFVQWNAVNGAAKSAVVEDGLPAMKVIAAAQSASGVQVNDSYEVPVTAGSYYRVRLTGKFPAVPMRLGVESRDGSHAILDTAIGNWTGSGSWETAEVWVKAFAGSSTLGMRLRVVGTSGGDIFIRRAEVQVSPVLYFDGGFEQGNFSQWDPRLQSTTRATIVSSNPTPRHGNYCARIEVQPGDVGGSSGNRTELWSPLSAIAGEELYIALSYWFPDEDEYPMEEDLWGNIAQLTLGGSTLDDFAVRAIDRADDGEVVEFGVNTPSETIWQHPLERERWTDIILHVKLSTDPAVGFVEVYYNGIKQTLEDGSTKDFRQTFDMDAFGLTQGIYRTAAHTVTQAIYVDSARVASTLEAVQ